MTKHGHLGGRDEKGGEVEARGKSKKKKGCHKSKSGAQSSNQVGFFFGNSESLERLVQRGKGWMKDKESNGHRENNG